MGDTLKQIAANLQNEDMAVLKANIDDLDKALEQDSFMVKAKLPEQLFKEVFLPAITGVDKNGGVAVMKYIEYAGGPYREVDVVDKNGKTLFTCPPMYNRSDTKNNNNIPYSQIASTYELKKARMANEANRYMQDVAGGISRNIVIEESSSEFKWNKIVERYTLPSNQEQSISDNIESVANDNENKIDDDMINYD